MTNFLHFPETTIVGRSVPKNAFWKRAERQSVLRQWLTDEVESITLAYKLHPSTLNVAPGDVVEEIDIFLLVMKGESYDGAMISQLDALLPRHTLFVIEHGDNTDILMHCKEMTEVGGERHWLCHKAVIRHCEECCDVAIYLKGQSMDTVYISLLAQISGFNVHSIQEYKQQAELRKRIVSLIKQITSLQENIRKEKQFNRQIEMNSEARVLKKQLSELEKQIK